MILVDTSVWIDHFNHTEKGLNELLLANQVCIHPFVIGELSCGNIANRKEVLSLLRALPKIDQVLDEEIYAFIEIRKLYGRGLGFIDIQLLASALVHGTRIWTQDKSLKRFAVEFKIGY